MGPLFVYMNTTGSIVERRDSDVIERLIRIEEGVKTVVKLGLDHESRIRSLEQWRWLIVGGGLVVGFLVSILK